MLALLNRYGLYGKWQPRLVFPLLLFLLALVSLRDYISGSITMLAIGTVAVAGSSAGRPPSRSRRYLWAALAMLLLALLLPVKTFLFFAVAFSLFYWLEQKRVSIGLLGTAALFFSSSVFNYLAMVFSFPIRMQLASWVSSFFAVWQKGVEVKGNTILRGGSEFAVDPACMGLHMLSISLLFGIVLIGLLEKRSGKRLSVTVTVAYLLIVFVLNVLANLLRIALLVEFTLLPGTLLHDLAGLACLLAYVCVPAAFLARAMVRKWAAPHRLRVVRKEAGRWPFILLAGLLCFTAIRSERAETYGDMSRHEAVPGYAASVYAPGIVKLEKPGALLYVKFIRGFYDTEHHPGFCWSGSGYAFENVQMKSIGGEAVFTARLVKGEEVLHTAWWYGNGRKVHSSQWAWRWDMMKGGDPYAVINVTAASEDGLMKEAGAIIRGNILKPLFR